VVAIGTVCAFHYHFGEFDAPLLACSVYNTAMYTVYDWCGQYGQCMVHTLAGAAGVWFVWTLFMYQ